MSKSLPQTPLKFSYAVCCSFTLLFQSESSWNSLTENTSMYETPNEVSLYVYESVELELSLTTNKIETDERIEDDYTCPIRLVKGKQLMNTFPQYGLSQLKSHQCSRALVDCFRLS